MGEVLGDHTVIGGTLETQDFLGYNETEGNWANFSLSAKSGLGLDWSESDGNAILIMTGGFNEISDFADRAEAEGDIMGYAGGEWGPFCMVANQGLSFFADGTAFTANISGVLGGTTGVGVVKFKTGEFKVEQGCGS